MVWLYLKVSGRYCKYRALTYMFAIVIPYSFIFSAQTMAKSNCEDNIDAAQSYSCSSDPIFTFRRVMLDFCGALPTFESIDELGRKSFEDQWSEIHRQLDVCLKSEFWIGKNGVLWQMAYPKVRPVGAIKAGEDAGPMAGTDYYDDFALFTFINTGDRDIRDLLLADYFVLRNVNEGKTTYQKVDELPMQFVQQERRAGMITTQFFLLRFIMAAIPRAAAAQLYRAYLGMDIAKGQGLNPVAGEPIDYDQKGVQTPECAICHSTLDPLSYPFSRYTEGCQTCGPAYPPFTYVPERLFLEPYPGLPTSVLETPENGHLFSNPVNDLIEVAEIAAQSDQFLISITKDYWTFLIGEENAQGDNEFEQLWRSLKSENNYQISKMLHSLIRTEAYSVP